jgi:hypothetical protein
VRETEWQKFVRPLLQQDEDWRFRKSLAYRMPTQWVLQGVFAEGSGFDKGIYIWRITMPLFVPSRELALTWSVRVGGPASKYFRLDQEAMANAVSSAAEGLTTERQTLQAIASRGSTVSGNRLAHEVVGYALLILGDLSGAQHALSQASLGHPSTDWEQAARARSDHVLQLASGDPERATDQLKAWCNESRKALGIAAS